MKFVHCIDTAGSDVVHLPKLQSASVVEKLALGAGGTKILTQNDFGKVFMCEQSGGTDSAVTLPAATSGGTLTFIVSLTPSGTGDMVISAATADTIVFAGAADAGAGGTDVGTEVVLNVTSGKEKDVIKALAEIISTGQNAFYTIADDDTSVYIHADLTSCGAIAEAK